MQRELVQEFGGERLMDRQWGSDAFIEGSTDFLTFQKRGRSPFFGVCAVGLAKRELSPTTVILCMVEMSMAVGRDSMNGSNPKD